VNKTNFNDIVFKLQLTNTNKLLIVSFHDYNNKKNKSQLIIFLFNSSISFQDLSRILTYFVKKIAFSLI